MDGARPPQAREGSSGISVDPWSTHARLRALFGRVLAVTSGVALACGGAIEDGTSGTSATAPRSLCGADRPEPFPAGLRASPLQDYVAARTESAFLQGTADGGEGDEDFVSTTSSATGVPCATAKDPADCNRRLAELRVLPRSRRDCEARFPNVTHPGGVHPGCRVGYLVFTRGDEVGAAIEDAEVASLVGAIDSVQEADWLLRHTYDPVCGGPKGPDYTVRELGTGYEFVFVDNCEQRSLIRTVHVGTDGTITERGRTKAPPGMQFTCIVAGRRPEGYARTRADGDGQGRYFAEAADLEAASVIAFRRLARELSALGAPRELVARARAAARDEVRHTRVMRALARREGLTPSPPSVLPVERRDVLAIALENAREGCVRETFGALVAWHQATHAEDAEVRAAMRAIAHDETAHAALSLDLAAWLDGRLDEAGRESVARARRRAYDELRAEVDAPLEASVRRAAGLPEPSRARAMLHELFAAA